MVQNFADNIILFWGQIEKKCLPEYVWEAEDLTFWQERILFSLCFIATVLAPVALAPSLSLCVQLDLWAVFILDILSYLMIIFIFLGRNLPLHYRVWTICFIIFSLGAGLLYFLGPRGAGYIWLFGSSVLAGTLIGVKAGLFTLFLNCLTFIIMAVLVSKGIPPWFVDGDSMLARWIVMSVNFMLLNIIITMTTAVLLKSLKHSLSKEKKYSKKLRESESKYRFLAENANDVIWTTDLNFKSTYISPSVKELSGYTPEEVMQFDPKSILSPASYKLSLKALHTKLIEEEKGENSTEPIIIETEYFCKGNGSVWAENSVTMIRDVNGKASGLIGISRDITDRKQGEAERRKNEKWLKTIFEAAKNVSFITTEPHETEPAILDFSPGAEKIFGYKKEEVIGRPASILDQPDNLVDFSKIFKQMKESQIGFSGEAVLVRKSGEHFPVLFSTHPLLNEDGQMHAALGVCIDISEQKELEKQLIQSEKMAALGGLVAGMVHEISTPLGVALTSASFLQDRTETFSERYNTENVGRSASDKFIKNAADASSMILTNISRAVDLINSFKQVAVDQTGGKIRNFNLKSYCKDIVFSLHPQLKQSGHMVNITGPDKLMLDSYPGAFYQILSNLIMNSLIHGFEGTTNGQILINIIEQNEIILINYNDNGQGIAKENIGKIFDPFFTTKRNHGGTGLGLHIVYNIVTQRLGGQISCENNEKKGVLFKIKLPLYGTDHTKKSEDSPKVP